MSYFEKLSIIICISALALNSLYLAYRIRQEAMNQHNLSIAYCSHEWATSGYCAKFRSKQDGH